ncbi:MAG: SAM-dependent methyltransferase [Treponema sp.]|jgi:type I restriction-modification system DNA methylase subunit|nr:SAM-dependent methyltransferase [Treponema sp.]
MLTKHGKDFIKLLENIKPSKNRYEIFNDWLVMASAALYSWKKDDAVENEYLEIVKQYKPEEVDQLSQLLSLTVEALEDQEQDFLGEVFTFAELSNTRNSQFFTPYHISYLMAEMAIGEKELPKNRVCKINDPCCGAGGMLIAGAMVMKKMGFSFQQDALFIGQDIDPRCARMTFIQLSLLGVPAVIICGNTITLEMYWQRETIGYYMAGMGFRLRAEELIERVKNLEQAEPEPEQIPIEIMIPRGELVQGELF